VTIDPDSPKNLQVIGMHMHSDGEHFHFVRGPGRVDEAKDENVKSAYALECTNTIDRLKQ